jgi:hypothetical protein
MTKHAPIPDGRPNPPAPDAGRIWRQVRSPYDDQLLIATVGWMRKLPRAIRPLETARRFPRILNRFAHNWDAPRMLDAFFEELLHDKRGTREGFPPAIYVEILHLRDYHYWLKRKRAARKLLAKATPVVGAAPIAVAPSSHASRVASAS